MKTIDKELAIQLAEDSKDIALKSIFSAVVMEFSPFQFQFSLVNDRKAITKSYIERGSILMSMEMYEDAISDFKSATSELKNLPDLDLKVEILYKLSTCYFT